MISGTRFRSVKSVIPVTKSTTGDLIILMSVTNINLFFIKENKVTEPCINNKMNNDIDQYKNAFSNNIDNNAIAPKRDLHHLLSDFRREIHLFFLNKITILSQDIPSTMKQFVLVGKHLLKVQVW